MSQRTWAAVCAVPLFLALAIYAYVARVPYVTYAPGETLDVLGDTNNHEIIDVQGHPTYRTDGQLRMVTVLVSRPDAHINLWDVMGDWLSKDSAVYPYDAVYQPNETDAQSTKQGAQQMVSSQQGAASAALAELGYRTFRTSVGKVDAGAPADGVLKPGDVLWKVDGQKVTTPGVVSDAVTRANGKPVTFVVHRGGKTLSFDLTPVDMDGHPRVGIELKEKLTLPFDVKVDVPENIGGPSAGLMFSLGIYDTLTPGSLTAGGVVAGTGTMDPYGNVGPIGGIQQKIAGARNDGAQLFLVPKDNCDEAVLAHNDDMRLAEVTTLDDAVHVVKTWAADHTASLPQCPGQK